jgi:hypothetical protein
MLDPSHELHFWTGVMRDHAEFFLVALSSREQEFVRSAQNFRDTFTAFNNEARRLQSDPRAVSALALRVLPVLLSFISFKRLVLAKLLTCSIELNFPPTFVNHMINEAMDFYSTLCRLMSNTVLSPVSENILLHKIWLPDAAGHAASIASDLDPTETMLIKEAEEFKNSFNHLFIKATELGLMLERTCLENGALKWLNEEAERKITEFICYLDSIMKLRLCCKAMGVIKPLLPDHMIREERYYLSNLAKFKSLQHSHAGNA